MDAPQCDNRIEHLPMTVSCQELYLEQRFGPLHLRAQEVLYECKQRKPDRDAVQSEELFHLTSEADDPAVLDAQAERRPGGVTHEVTAAVL